MTAEICCGWDSSLPAVGGASLRMTLGLVDKRAG